MPAKKPSKPVKAKKTVSPKAAPAKKTAAKPAKSVAPAKHAAAKTAKPAKAPAKEHVKAVKPEPVKKPVAPPKQAAKAPAPEVKMPVQKPESKPANFKPEVKPAPVKPAANLKSGPKPVVAVGTVEKKKPSQHADGEEGEDSSAGLLAGPRNVTPYQVKRGEQYMNKEQLDHFRQILASWKRDLMEEVDRTVLHMKDEAANFPDPNDRATQESEFSLELRTRDRERKLIRKIEEALQRVEDGSYGYCVETGEEIGVKRLEARPVATLCVEAQERRERREKQYGDRDDRYR